MEGFKPIDFALSFIAKRRAKTQAALNEAYEPLEWDVRAAPRIAWPVVIDPPDVQFAVIVGYLIKDIFIGMFLCMLVPVVVPVIFVFLFFHYWIIKYNMLRRSGGREGCLSWPAKMKVSPSSDIELLKKARTQHGKSQQGDPPPPSWDTPTDLLS